MAGSKARDDAEIHFDRTQKIAQKPEQAMSRQATEARTVDEKTARLRGLRLANEAADKKVAAAKKPRRAKSIPVEKLNASNDK